METWGKWQRDGTPDLGDFVEVHGEYDDRSHAIAKGIVNEANPERESFSVLPRSRHIFWTKWRRREQGQEFVVERKAEVDAPDLVTA